MSSPLEPRPIKSSLNGVSRNLAQTPAASEWRIYRRGGEHNCSEQRYRYDSLAKWLHRISSESRDHLTPRAPDRATEFKLSE